MIKTCLVSLLSLAAAGALTSPAMAQQLSRAGGPIQIDADKSVVKQRENKAIYSGNVDVRQGDARLRADELVINFAGQTDSDETGGVSRGFGDLVGMVATGDVFYITADFQARGDKADYDEASETVILRGNVVVGRGEDVAKGECLRLDIANDVTTLGCDQGDRATTIINPSNDNAGN